MSKIMNSITDNMVYSPLPWKTIPEGQPNGPCIVDNEGFYVASFCDSLLMEYVVNLINENARKE